MRISERQLRRIIRREIIKINEGIIPYSDEKGAQGLSAVQQLKYAAAQGILDAGQSGARQVATGQVPLPTVGQITKNAWNSSIMDWTLTSLGALADFLPGPGTVVSIAIAQVQLLKAAVASDWLGCAFAVLAMFPGVGDALGILGRLVDQGAQVSANVAEAAVKAIMSVGDSELKAQINKVAKAITDPTKRQKVIDNIPSIVHAKEKFISDLNRSIVSSTGSTAA
jgi:hypothetical protein